MGEEPAQGQVSHADVNSACNIKVRAQDSEINRYTPHKTVKKILLKRLQERDGIPQKLVNFKRTSTDVLVEVNGFC